MRGFRFWGENLGLGERFRFGGRYFRFRWERVRYVCNFNSFVM